MALTEQQYKKLRKFKDLIWSHYGQDKNYDNIYLSLLNIRQSLIRSQPEITDSLSVSKLFDLSISVFLITSDTLLQHMNENRPISEPEDKFYKNSINRPTKEFLIEKI